MMAWELLQWAQLSIAMASMAFALAILGESRSELAAASSAMSEAHRVVWSERHDTAKLKCYLALFLILANIINLSIDDFSTLSLASRNTFVWVVNGTAVRVLVLAMTYQRWNARYRLWRVIAQQREEARSS
jgi:hypothetical protein